MPPKGHAHSILKLVEPTKFKASEFMMIISYANNKVS